MERHLDLLATVLGIATLQPLTVLRDEDSPDRARRLDRRRDDDPAQLIDVVRRTEHLAESRDRIAQTRTLGAQLVQPCLQLRGHLVEGPSEQRKLIASLNGYPLLEVAASDCTRG